MPEQLLEFSMMTHKSQTQDPDSALKFKRKRQRFKSRRGILMTGLKIEVEFARKEAPPPHPIPLHLISLRDLAQRVALRYPGLELLPHSAKLRDKCQSEIEVCLLVIGPNRHLHWNEANTRHIHLIEEKYTK